MFVLPEIEKDAEMIGLASDSSGLAMKFSIVALFTAEAKTQEVAINIADLGLFFSWEALMESRMLCGVEPTT